jgi:hypothetical protein
VVTGAADAAFARVKELFSLAESRLKLVEHLSGEVAIPCINQLRYAGFHLLEALSAADSILRAEHIHEAEIHASRAAYDALDAGILYLLMLFDQFKQDYRFITIGDVVPGYLEMCEKAESARHANATIQNRNHVNMHLELEEHFGTMQELVSKLDPAREELNKKLRNWKYGVAGTVVGIFIALAGVIVAIVVA